MALGLLKDLGILIAIKQELRDKGKETADSNANGILDQVLDDHAAEGHGHRANHDIYSNDGDEQGDERGEDAAQGIGQRIFAPPGR